MRLNNDRDVIFIGSVTGFIVHNTKSYFSQKGTPCHPEAESQSHAVISCGGEETELYFCAFKCKFFRFRGAEGAECL